MRKIRTSGLSFLLILALAFLLRVPFLSCLPFDSDQAIVGLMARHIVSGEFPLLYYGDSYGGALEPALASIFLHLFGTDRFILQLIPFLISLAFIISIYQLGSELFTRAVGLLSLLFATIPLYYSGLYSALANGGYIEILWLGNVLLMISHRLAVRDNPSARARTRYFILGLLSGLAWWTHPLSIAYLVTAYLFLCLNDKKFLLKIRFIYALAGLITGSIPFWIWNLKQGLPFLKFINAVDSIPFGTRLKAAYLNLLQFFGLHLKGEWDGAVYFFVLLVFLSLISLFFSKPSEGHFPKTKTSFLLWAFALVFSAIYCGSRFSEEEVLRYLLPLYSLFPISLAWFVYSMRSFNRFIAWAFITGILIFQAHGYLISIHLYQDQQLKNQRQFQVEKILLDFLKSETLDTAYSPEYWTGPRLTFDSREKIIVAHPFNDRYPLYTLLADASPRTAFVLDGKYPQAFEEMLQALGATCQKRVISLFPGTKGYVAYNDFSLAPPASVEILPSQWIGGSNVNPGAALLAYDRNASTRWSTGGPQAKGQWYQIDLGASFRLNRLALTSGRGGEDHFPRNYRLETSLNGREWTEAVSVRNNWAYLFWSLDRPFWKWRTGRTEIALKAKEARFIRITLTDSALQPWSIAEIFAYREAEKYNPAPLRFEEMVAFLNKEKIRYVYADIGISARLTSLTQGKIRCLMDDYNITNALDYPRNGYNEAFPFFNDLRRRVDLSWERAFVVKKENDQAFIQAIKKLARAWQIKILGDYILYYHLTPSAPSSSTPYPSYWNGTHLLSIASPAGAGHGS